MTTSPKLSALKIAVNLVGASGIALLSSHALAIGFAAGTMIATPKGQVPIETLERGDEVISCAANGKCTVGTVEDLDRSEQKALKISTNLGDIVLGREERLWLSGKWVLAQDINVGDVLKHQCGGVIKVQGKERMQAVMLYALEVEPDHNFYANTVLVHNYHVMTPADQAKILGDAMAMQLSMAASSAANSAAAAARMCAKGAAEELPSSLVSAAGAGRVGGMNAAGVVLAIGLGKGCAKKVWDEGSGTLVDVSMDQGSCAIM